MSVPRDIEFLYEIGSLRNVPRGWRQHLGMDCSSDLEHTYRVVWLALIIARHEGKPFDEKKLLTMALLHDIPETRVSDHSYVQKAYVTEINETAAAQDMFKDTILEDMVGTFTEYEKRESFESKIVKDADNLDIDIELKELAERGSTIPKKFQKFREMVRNDKLYTETARKFFDAIQQSDSDSWHLATNKWLRIANAGK
jgi:putative hydrolase of HD superfamily